MAVSLRPLAHPILALAAAAAVLTWAGDPTPHVLPFEPAPGLPDAQAEVTATATDYGRAWYEGNAAMLSATLHPEFIRTTVHHAPTKDVIENASGPALVDLVNHGSGRGVDLAQRRTDVTEVKVNGGVATASLVLADRTESLQLVRWNDRWRILQSVTERAER